MAFSISGDLKVIQEEKGRGGAAFDQQEGDPMVRDRRRMVVICSRIKNVWTLLTLLF
jgi:hypothetical protein